MRPPLARWTYSNKAPRELGRSASIGDVRSAHQTDRSLASINRPTGIVRIRISSSTTPVAENGSRDDPKDEQRIKDPQKDDDDADSAVSLENCDDSYSSNNFNRPMDQPTSILPIDQSKKFSQDLMNEREEPRERKYQQRRPPSSKRANHGSGFAITKSRSAMRHQARSEMNHQLTASGGASTIATWKLRKAMKTFKMNRLTGDSGSSSDFGGPHIQYFLASLCDHSVSSANSELSLATSGGTDKDFDARYYNSSANGLKARCPLAAEVQKVVSKLRSSQPVNAQGFQLSVAVTVLKEFLSGIPGGVFGELTQEFYQISLQSSLELTIVYLHSILHEMPYVVQQFTYLLCKALRNLVRMTGGNSLKNYTDLLMHFTPVLFSSSVGDVEKFLRAARLLLVMVDDCERVFLPLPWLDANGNWCWHNGDFEDETFFRQIFDSLQNLEARLATDDSGVESEPDEPSKSAGPSGNFVDNPPPIRRSVSIADFYQVVYLDDVIDEVVAGEDNRCG